MLLSSSYNSQLLRYFLFDVPQTFASQHVRTCPPTHNHHICSPSIFLYFHTSHKSSLMLYSPLPPTFDPQQTPVNSTCKIYLNSFHSPQLYCTHFNLSLHHLRFTLIAKIASTGLSACIYCLLQFILTQQFKYSFKEYVLI